MSSTTATLKAYPLFFLVSVQFVSDFEIDGKAHSLFDCQQRMQKIILHDITAHMSKLLLVSRASIYLDDACNVFGLVTRKQIQERAFAATARPDNHSQLSSPKLSIEIFQHFLII